MGKYKLDYFSKYYFYEENRKHVDKNLIVG